MAYRYSNICYWLVLHMPLFVRPGDIYLDWGPVLVFKEQPHSPNNFFELKLNRNFTLTNSS